MKIGNFFRICALLAAGLVVLGSCLNPIDFDPDKALATIKVTGALDFTDVSSAVLMISNRSKTIDATKVVITQSTIDPVTKEESFEPVVEFNSKPKSLTNKAQYLKPSDQEYKVEVYYEDKGTKVDTPKTVIISTPVPKETYWLYLYRDKNGEVILDPMLEPDNVDPSDTGNPVMLPEDEGEGSVPWYIPAANRSHMGVFVVINLTKDQDVDYVEFTTPKPVDSPDYKKYRINGEPGKNDQQGIALTMGQWVAQMAYTPRNGTQKLTATKNAIVMVMTDSPQAMFNYMYFYKTKAGAYELSMWPPSSSEMADDNVEPETFLEEGQGILELTNKSENAEVIENIRIDGHEYLGVMMAKDDVRSFVLPAGTANVAFQTLNKIYGLTLPRAIASKKITTLSYYDNLGNPDIVPQDLEGNGIGLVKINNQANATVQTVYIIDPQDPMGMKLVQTPNGFSPQLPINQYRTGWITISGTEDFKLNPSVTYLIQVELQGGGDRVYADYYRVVKDQLVTIEIKQTDLPGGSNNSQPGEATKGAKVTIENALPSTIADVSITGMQVWNTSAPIQRAYHGNSMWVSPGVIGNGKSASLLVTSTPEMPIVNGATYKADVFLQGNGKNAVITKEFTPDGRLYSDKPDANLKTLRISESDIPDDLIGIFTPVTDITGIPTEVTSMVLYQTTTLVGPGFINLNAAQVIPGEATNQNITWTKSGSSTGDYTIENGILRVTAGKTAGTETNISIVATIAKGSGTLASQTNYTKTFNIKLKYDSVKPESKLATKLVSAGKMGIYVDDTQSLLGRITIEPVDAFKDGVPITVSDLLWNVSGGGSYIKITGSNIVGLAKGTGQVTVTLPAQYCKDNIALTASFDVEVGELGSGALFTNVESINFTPTTVVSYVVPGTSSLISAGWLNLNTATVSPTSATKKQITWTLSGGDTPYIDESKLAGGILLVKSAPSVSSGTVNKSVKLKATVKGGMKTSDGTDIDYIHAQEFTVTLSFATWTYSNYVTKIDLTSGNTMGLYEKDIKSLLGMVKLNPVVAYNNGTPITISDLDWEVGTKTAGGNVTISGSNITGVSAGLVTIRAKLAAAKNGGTAIYSEYITVTIRGVPTISDNAKAAFWFLFQSVNDGIVFVPCTDNDFTDTERLTGVTSKTWASTDADFNKTNFQKKYPGAIISGRMSASGYTPGRINEGQPRPMTYPDTGRYYVFFIKKEAGKTEERVYGNGPATPAGNTLFLLDLEWKGPSMILQNQSGAVKETTMWTSWITYDPSLTGVITESNCTIKEEGETYSNNMGIPIGIYRFKYWNNKIEFLGGKFYN